MATTEIILSTQALDGSLTPAKVSTNPSDNFLFPGNLSITDDKQFVLGNSNNAWIKYSSGHGGLVFNNNGSDAGGMSSVAFLGLYANTAADGSGTYLPSFEGLPNGNCFVNVSNTNHIWLEGQGVVIDDSELGTSPDASAKLQIESTTQGFLPPRMDTAARDAIATPATGLQIFNTDSNQPEVYNGTIWTSMAGGNTVFNDDVFTAVADGTGQIFTLSDTAVANSEVINHNGLVLRPTVDYTISGTTLTILENVLTGDSIQATYAHDTGGVGVTPGGLNGQIQYKNGGMFAGATVSYDPTAYSGSPNLNINGSLDPFADLSVGGKGIVSLQSSTNDQVGILWDNTAGDDSKAFISYKDSTTTFTIETTDPGIPIKLTANTATWIFDTDGNFTSPTDQATIKIIPNLGGIALLAPSGNVETIVFEDDTESQKAEITKTIGNQLYIADYEGGLSLNATTVIELNGGIRANVITTTSASYTILATDYTIIGNATSNNIATTLPLASAIPGRLLNFKKNDSSANTVTINRTGSDTIDGQTSVVLTVQYQTVTIQSDGTNWNIL